MIGGLVIERRDEVGVAVLTLSGELDVTTAPELEQRLAEIFADAPERVLLDLHGLMFVDSAGVSVLIKAKNRAAEAGLELVLRRATAQVHDVFAVVGLGDWLELEPA